MERADNWFPRKGTNMKRSPRPRSIARLPDSVLHQLNMYALGAAAAGVAALGLVQSVDGEIVYTPAHKTVPLNRTIPIDLNHDGIHDFGLTNITHNSTTPFGDFLAASPLNSGDEIWVQATTRGFNNYAAALREGVRIGPTSRVKRFQAGRDFMAFRSSGSRTVSGGPWKNVHNRYLGLKFLIRGKVHYGWARLNVTIAGQAVNATLTGYAYETIPNKAIVAGQTKGDSTLGRLAMGK
jgi:hypothetical protein